MRTETGTGELYQNTEYICSATYKLNYYNEGQLSRSDMSGTIECKMVPPLNEGGYVLKLSDGQEVRVQIMAGTPIGNNPHNGFSYKIRLSGTE